MQWSSRVEDQGGVRTRGAGHTGGGALQREDGLLELRVGGLGAQAGHAADGGAAPDGRHQVRRALLACRQHGRPNHCSSI
jgi:hypothetical protein